MGFAVLAAPDGEQIETLLTQQPIDLLILDLMLPREDGLSICRRVRAKGWDVPIIMLTARGADIDRIVGLEVGADDYLPKPFNPRELVARINAVLRRRPLHAAGAPAATCTVVRFGHVMLNLGTRTLAKAGERLSLTTGEFAVLEALVLHPGQPLSREKLIEIARGRDYSAFDRSMDVQVSRLRRLIEEDSANPRFIQTVWGVGYVFVPDEPAA
jgi:two-component system phosphate regulon response regulator OmpR